MPAASAVDVAITQVGYASSRCFVRGESVRNTGAAETERRKDISSATLVN